MEKEHLIYKRNTANRVATCKGNHTKESRDLNLFRDSRLVEEVQEKKKNKR